MKRRGFLRLGCGSCCALLWRGAQADGSWQVPARFSRPDLSTEEGGLWGLMDREETRLRRSPFTIRDPALRDYVQDIACRLGGDHCPDIRVHLVKTPYFNASMAPNGMMQVWTGLLLRMENEAQLAAVLGHEIGHYLSRHSLERLRDAKSKSAFAQILGLFGPIGALGQLGVLASMLAYSRDQEREADRIGIELMGKAGFDTREAAKVWQNMVVELKAKSAGEGAGSVLFATHPALEERLVTLRQLAQDAPGAVQGDAAWQQHMKPYERDWLSEEVKRGRLDESIALLTRMLASRPAHADYLAARADAYRLRSSEADLDLALADYEAALRAQADFADAYRGLGAIYRRRQDSAHARDSYRRYLKLAPRAPDAALVKNYLEETP